MHCILETNGYNREDEHTIPYHDYSRYRRHLRRIRNLVG